MDVVRCGECSEQNRGRRERLRSVPETQGLFSSHKAHPPKQGFYRPNQLNDHANGR